MDAASVGNANDCEDCEIEEEPSDVCFCTVFDTVIVDTEVKGGAVASEGSSEAVLAESAMAGDWGPPTYVTEVYTGHSVHVVVVHDVKSASALHHDVLIGRSVIVTVGRLIRHAPYASWK